MNNDQRKKLGELVAQLSNVGMELEAIRDKEQDEWADLLSKNLEGTEHGQALNDAATILDTAISNVEDAVNNIEELL